MDVDEYGRLLFINGNQLIRFHAYYDVLYSHKNDLESIKFTGKKTFVGTEDSYGGIIIDTINNYSFRKKFDQVEAAVTHIAESNYGNFILSKNTVFHFQDKVARKYSFPGIVDYLSDVNGSTIIHDDENGLSIFVNGRFKIVNNSLFLSKQEVVDIKSINVGEYVVATKNDGLYVFDGESFIPFGADETENETIKSVEVVKKENSDYEIVFITANNELISLNKSGNLLFRKSYRTKVYDLLFSNNKLYLATQEGIDVFFYNLPFHIVDFSSDAIHGPLSIFNNRLYWGAVNGLYYKKINENNQLVNRAVKVKDTDGKVGKLDIVQNTLLMSHEDGLYDVLPAIGARFIPDEKFFNFVEIADQYLIAFGKRNNYLLHKVRGKWRVQKTLDNLPIHPKSIVFSTDSKLWLVDRDYNLIRYSFNGRNLRLNEEFREANNNKVKVFSVRNELVLIKNNQAYTYQGNEFVISKDLSAVLGDRIDLEQIKNDQYGNVWYIENGHVGIFRSFTENGKKKYKKLTIDYPFADPRSIYPYDKNNIFINNGDHYVQLDLEKYVKKKLSPVTIDRIYTQKENGEQQNKYLMERNDSSEIEATCKSDESLHVTFFNELIPDSKYKIQGENISKILESPKYEGTSKIFDDEMLFTMSDYHDQSTKVEAEIDTKVPFVGSFPFWVMLGLVNVVFWIIAFYLGYHFKKLKTS